METKYKKNFEVGSSNQINVSSKKSPNFYVFLGKKYFEDHEIVHFHSLGNAI